MRAAPAALFALALSASAQDPADEVALALLQGRPEAAARAAANGKTPAQRARLQAALLPASGRAAAMLAMARTFLDDPEADSALVAGAAAVLDEASRSEAVPELTAWRELEGDRDADPEGLAPIVVGLGEVLEARRAAGGDPALLQEAERLLSLARVTRFGLWPARVPVGAVWQRPTGQREPLELRLLPCGPGHLPWAQLADLGAPAWAATLPVTGPVEVPTLPIGDWLLEARSTRSPWRGVRRVLVSDLEAVAVTQDGWLAMAAFDPGGAAAATWELWRNGAAAEHGELGAAPALVHLAKATVERVGAAELRLRGERGTAWLDMRDLSFTDPERERWLAHVMVDRPVFRPGETVQGRLVLRTCRWDGEGFGCVPTTAPAATATVTLVVSCRSTGAIRQPLRTDAQGLATFSFVVPAETTPGEDLSFEVELPETDSKGEPLRLRVGELCGVAEFRRQAVVPAVDGPESVRADAEHVDVSVRAEWASGGPAAGLDVKARINARYGWEREEAVLLRTDAEGRATVRVPIASVEPRWVDVDFTVTGPDGKAVAARHRLAVVQPGDPDAQPAVPQWLASRVPELELGEAQVGAPCRITLRGMPGLHVLVVVGRSHNARVRSATLGADGQATFDEPVLRCDWPRFDVTAATAAGHDERATAVHLRAMAEVELSVPELAAPGHDTTVKAHSDAPGALVTFAVVDERIFELTADRTPDPEAAFRPWMPYPGWRPFDSPVVAAPVDLLASLSEHGRLPRLGWTRDLSRRAGRAASGSAGSPMATSVRTRFSPTAHFATVVADERGDAATTFRLPDDLTRWRVTAVVVTPDGTGTIARKTFASRQPLALEPVLPRALRVGDSFELPLAIDRSADAAGRDTAVVTAAATGPALAVERSHTELEVRAGRVVATSVPMRAVAAGDATLQLAVELGSHVDRSERAFAIAEDRVARPLVAAASGTGEVVVPLPAGASVDAPVTVDVLQGGVEAWRRIEQELAHYPYGCAEQTLSRLLPRFALLRSAKARGEQPPELDAEFGVRLREGLAHLRALQPDSSRQFAFWPGQSTEPGITALVLHGLSVLRDGGFDLARSGLGLHGHHFRDALPKEHDVHVVDGAFVMVTEKLAGAVRLFPDDDYTRRLLQPALELLPKLPAGLCARIGLALHGAGDVLGARACRQRLQDAALPALARDGFPGEDPLAVQALRLELDAALGAPVADLQRAAAELLLQCLAGRGTTYGHACALSALAMVLPPTAAAPGTIVIEAGAQRRECAIGGAAGASIRVRLPPAAAVTVRGPADMPLLVRVATERSERASDHAAWATPIRVERQWCTVRADATYNDRCDGKDLVPHAGPLLAGRPFVLRLVVTSPVAMRHVVVDCPLPAGCELPDDVEGVERHDDRVVFVCDLEPGEPQVLRLVVAPTVVGRFVWPPAVAMPMYCSGDEGGTAGGWIDVAPVPPGSVPSFAMCLQAPRPAAIDEPPDPVDEWCGAFADAFDEQREPEREIAVQLLGGTMESWEKTPLWGEAGPDEEVRARLVEALWAKLPPAGAELWPRLHRLTDLLARLDEPGSDAEWPERAWRLTAYARLQGLVMELAVVVLDFSVPTGPKDVPERVWHLLRTLEHCPPTLARDVLIARWWSGFRALDGAEDALLELLSPPPQDPSLRQVLRELAVRTKGSAFGRVWSLLDADERAALSPSLVLDAAEPDMPGVIGVLAAEAAGYAELRRRIESAEFILLHFEVLQHELPAALWDEVPLAAFGGLATAAVQGEQGVTAEFVITHLTRGPFATGALQQELAAAKVPAWRFLLASALRQRGAQAGSATSAEWAAALALAPDDVAGAMALLAAAKAQSPGPDLSGEQQMLAGFVVPGIVAHATPAQLYAARETLDAAHWAAAWARLGSGERVALLGHFQKHISEEFVPAAAEEAEALWQFLHRSGDVEGTLGAMLGSLAGTECVRRHLLAGDGGEKSAAVRTGFAAALVVDEQTLQPDPGKELPALLARLRSTGFAGAFSPVEAELLRRLRLHRGL